MALRYLCALPLEIKPLWNGADAEQMPKGWLEKKSPNSSFYDEPASKSATGIIHPVFGDEKERRGCGERRKNQSPCRAKMTCAREDGKLMEKFSRILNSDEALLTNKNHLFAFFALFI